MSKKKSKSKELRTPDKMNCILSDHNLFIVSTYIFVFVFVHSPKSVVMHKRCVFDVFKIAVQKEQSLFAEVFISF